MSITTKLIDSSARMSSRGTQIVQVYGAEETGGTLLQGAGSAAELLTIVNANLTTGPPIPLQGSDQQFDIEGNPVTLPCVEVIPRLARSCRYATFQCRFSNFSYWSGPGAPLSPDPRVVSIQPSAVFEIPAPKFVETELSAEGGTGGVTIWAPPEIIPLRVREERLTVRVYLPSGITDGVYGSINDQIGFLHTFSDTDWEFLGASAREEAGGFVAGDPVYLYYEWRTERSNTELFSNGLSRDPKIYPLPPRGSFRRYVWSQMSDSTPVVVAEIPESESHLNTSSPNGWQGFPGNPILT